MKNIGGRVHSINKHPSSSEKMTNRAFVGTSIFLLALCFSSAQVNAKCENSSGAEFPMVTGNNGSEVIDRATGLIWQRCLVGKTWDNAAAKCTGSARNMTWDAVTDHIQKLPKSARAWRLPTHFELLSLVDFNCSDSAKRNKWFVDPDSTFLWSGSSYASLADYAWGLKYGRGELSYELKSDEFQSLLVRSER